MKFKIILISAVIALFCSVYASGMGQRKAEIEYARDFILRDLEGKKVSLSDFRGKFILLNFWATWCPPCRHEMPSIEKLHRKYGGSDFVILAVATDSKGEKIVKPFIRQKGFTFKTLIDDKNEIFDSYGLFALPTTYIVGRDGMILRKVQGEVDWFSQNSIEYFEDLIGKADGKSGDKS